MWSLVSRVYFGALETRESEGTATVLIWLEFASCLSMHVKLSCHHDSRLAKSRGRVLESPSAIGWVLSNLMDVSVGHDGTPPSLWQNLIDSCLIEQAIALIIVFFVDVRAWAWQLASRKFICQFQVIMSLDELMRSISKRLLLHMVGVQCTKCTDGTIMFFFVCFVPCV
jgi:hypothetical protein